MKGIYSIRLLLAAACLAPLSLTAQITERERPAEWEHLITGGRYMDRFKAMPEGTLSKDTWGADSVRPRYIDNGIERPDISFWGGNIIQTPDRKNITYSCADGPKAHPKDTWNGPTPRSIMQPATDCTDLLPFRICLLYTSDAADEL